MTAAVLPAIPGIGIDHSLIETALEAWFTNLGLQVYHRDRAEPAVRLEAKPGTNEVTQAIGSYKFISSVNPGWDEKRQTAQTGVGADPLLLDETVTGPRIMACSIQVKSFRNLPQNHAFELAERLRTRLRFTTIEALFATAGIALANTTDVVDISFDDRNGRRWGMAAFDCIVNAAIGETDVATDTIGTIELTSDYKGEDGNSLPAANQLDDFVIDLDNPP